MMCNLLFNGTINSINILSYLRKKNIPSDQFADYLYKKYSIVLTNISNDVANDNINNIIHLINTIKKPTYLLLIGKKAQEKFMNIKNNYIKGYDVFIHPSGNNLNKPSTQKIYYDNWYKLKGSIGEEQNIIDKFILFK